VRPERPGAAKRDVESAEGERHDEGARRDEQRLSGAPPAGGEIAAMAAGDQR